MKYRPLGRTGLRLPWLSFGASSLGQEFRTVDLNEALRSVRVALDLGMNFIDTSPFYGRGMSEVLLGVALRGVPRDQLLSSAPSSAATTRRHFDFSARRVVESVDVSLHRMGVDHLDIMLCHDIEFVDMQQIVDETLPALRKIQQQGKVRFIGISGYPMKMFRFVLDHTDLDVILSYNHYTLQNTMLADLVPYLKDKGSRHHERGPVLGPAADQRAACRPGTRPRRKCARSAKQAADHCASRGVDIAQLALQYSHRQRGHGHLHRRLGQSRQRAKSGCNGPNSRSIKSCWHEVLEILKPIHNWFYIEGRPENNDPSNEKN